MNINEPVFRKLKFVDTSFYRFYLIEIKRDKSTNPYTKEASLYIYFYASTSHRIL